MDLTVNTQQRAVLSRRDFPEHLKIKPASIGHRIKKDIVYISAISVTPDGSRLAVLSNNLAAVYDVLNETEIMTYEINGSTLRCIHISNSGKILGIGTSQGEVIIYDIDKKNEIHSFKKSSGVNCVYFSEHLKITAVADEKTVSLHSMDTGKLTHQYETGLHPAKIFIYGKYNYLYVQSYCCSELYNLKSGNIVARLSEFNAEGPFETPSGRCFMMNIIKNEVMLWDITTGVQKCFKHPATVCEADVNIEGNTLTTTCMDERLRIFDIQSKQTSLDIYMQPDIAWRNNTLANSSKCVFFASDIVRALDKKTGELMAQICGHSRPLIAACLSRDGQHLYTGGYNGTLKCYNLLTGRNEGSFEKHRYRSWLSSIALNEDKNMVATGSHDSTAKLFTLSGRLIHTLKGHQGCVHSVAISPDGNLVATGARDQKVMLWDYKTGACVRYWDAHFGWVRSVAFDSAGKRILTGGKDGIAKLWDLNGKLIERYGYHDNDIYSALFSPDEECIATASHDATFKLYNIDGRLMKIFKGHTNGVREIFFHTDGTIISVSLDQTAKRWDPATGKCIRTYRSEHTDWIRCVWVRKDSVLIMGSKDGTISFNDLETGKHLASLINTGKGFLWTSPPDDNAKSGWFYTDREDLIETIETDAKGEVTVIERDSEKSRNYISTYNSMQQITNRLSKKTGNKQFEKLVDLHTDIQRSQQAHRLLQGPESL